MLSACKTAQGRVWAAQIWAQACMIMSKGIQMGLYTF